MCIDLVIKSTCCNRESGEYCCMWTSYDINDSMAIVQIDRVDIKLGCRGVIPNRTSMIHGPVKVESELFENIREAGNAGLFLL